jgi:predicted PurR-regulated permease PerM
MDEAYFNKIMTTIILAVLVVLSFFLLRPILISIIVGIILAFVFTPVYNWLVKKTNMKNLSAIIISLILIILIITPVWLFTPIIVDQSIKIYLTTQKMDFITPLENFFPSLFASKEFSNQVGSIIYSFVNKTVNSIMVSFSNLIINFPTLFLQLMVAFFTFFFILRDKEQFIDYIKSLLPFSKEVEKKLFEQTQGITMSVLYGQVVIGILQGLIAGLGFFIFGVPNALFLTIFACLAGIFPIIGTTIIWVPVAIYLLATGSSLPAIGVIVFGIVASTIDNVLKPILVAKRTSLPTSITLIGMVGGFFLFGILGFIIGPLILAYLLIILEIYRNKRVPGILTKQPAAQKLKINI